MTVGVQGWLPIGAVDCDAVRSKLKKGTDEWAGKWFVRTGAAATGFDTCGGVAPTGDWLPGGLVAVALADAAVDRIACLALGAPSRPPVLSEADRDILEGIATSVASDLGASLEKALGGAPATREAGADPFDGQGGLLFDIVDSSGQKLLHVAIPSAPIIALRKAVMKPSRRRSARLAPLGQTADATRIRIGARLGIARLPLAEVAGLAAGDVLVLDRSVDDGAELSLAACGRPVGRGQLLPGESALSILIDQ